MVLLFYVNIKIHTLILSIYVLLYIYFDFLIPQSFAMPVLFKGRQKTLEQTDLYRPLKKHKSGKCNFGKIELGFINLKVNIITRYTWRSIVCGMGWRSCSENSTEATATTGKGCGSRLWLASFSDRFPVVYSRVLD